MDAIGNAEKKQVGNMFLVGFPVKVFEVDITGICNLDIKYPDFFRIFLIQILFISPLVGVYTQRDVPLL